MDVEFEEVVEGVGYVVDGAVDVCTHSVSFSNDWGRSIELGIEGMVRTFLYPKEQF